MKYQCNECGLVVDSLNAAKRHSEWAHGADIFPSLMFFKHYQAKG